MILYLVRHAHAVTDEDDAARPLSDWGREQMRCLATFFSGHPGFRPGQLWHSPLLRARQTAELLRRDAVPDTALVETPGLTPEDDPQEIAERLAKVTTLDQLALVGHEPHMSALATLLVRGKPSPVAFEMKKGAVLALEKTGEVHRKTGEPRWTVLWFVTPGLVGKAKGD